jgi:ferric iron reductase protein FhuF
LLGEERELANRRVNDHWQQVQVKQALCRQLKHQLCTLKRELESLEREEKRASRVFEAALQPLNSHLENCQQAYDSAVWNTNRLRLGWTVDPVVRATSEDLGKAKKEYDAMAGEQHSSAGARSPEGKALQRASTGRFGQ